MPAKLIEDDYDTQLASVYNLGNHTCSLQLDMMKCNQVLMKRLQEKNPTGSAKEVGLREIGLLMNRGRWILLLMKLKTGLTIEL